MKKLFAIFMALILLVSSLLCACNNPGDTDTNTDTGVQDTNSDKTSDSDDNKDKVDDKSPSSNETGIKHNLKVENSIKLDVFENEKSSSSSDNTIDYTTATDIDVSEVANGKTCVIEKSGIYRIHGTTYNGQILVNLNGEVGGDGHVVLVLDNLNMTYNGKKSVIYAEKCESVTVILPENTTSTLTDSANNEEKGVIYVKSSPLIVDGKGTLNLNAKSPKSRGIFNTKELTVNGGIINIVSDNSHGIQGEQALTINGGVFDITSKKSGIKTGDYDEDKPTEAVEGVLTINGGSLKINSTTNGISAYGEIIINDGYLNVNSTTDGIDASKDVTLNGGVLIINAFSDGIKSDKEVKIQGEASVKLLTTNDGIDAFSVSISTSSVVYIKTNVDNKAFIEDPQGSYIIKNKKYIEVAPTDYPNVTRYSLLSCKGIKLDGSLKVTGGTVGISAYEDAIDCIDVTLDGGRVVIESVDDGIDISGTVAISGVIEIINSNKGIKAPTVTVNENGVVTVISTSDAIDSSLVTVNGGTVYLLEKLDLQDGKLIVNGGTVIALSSTKDAVLSCETQHNNISISGYKAVENLVYGNWFRISDGTRSIVLRLPKGYDKLSVTCISDAISNGTFTFDVGTYQVGEKINSFVYTNGTFTVIDTYSTIIE